MGEMTAHPTAVIEAGAKLGAGVKIGPYCVVGSQVVLGDGVELISHAVVAGSTTIGARTRIFPFASIGHQPQDLKYRGEASRLADLDSRLAELQTFRATLASHLQACDLALTGQAEADCPTIDAFARGSERCEEGRSQ